MVIPKRIRVSQIFCLNSLDGLLHHLLSLGAVGVVRQVVGGRLQHRLGVTCTIQGLVGLALGHGQKRLTALLLVGAHRVVHGGIRGSHVGRHVFIVA